MSPGIRRRGRELALKIIYSLKDQSVPIGAILDDFWQNFRFQEDVLGDPHDDFDTPVPEDVRKFAEDIAIGVDAHCAEIDRTISECSTNWSLERMARVDLALLRLATFELLYRPEVPTNVVINEAVEIGKRYGTLETSAFVNGILDKVSRTCRRQAP
ncbi:MAG TPA: transcription antitermination factor NusB [Desulfuromonadales bacterium]|nr:transcription antitermination factor NusB [Desulfuromonadales bacterium]